MLLGEMLVAERLVRQEDVQRARDHGKQDDGHLGRRLVDEGALTEDQLAGVLNRVPASPKSVDETGLRESFLTALTLKVMYAQGLNSSVAIADILRLPTVVVETLLRLLLKRQWIDPMGAADVPDGTADPHFVVSPKGREHAAVALTQSNYAGPAPVSLAAYQAQVEKQRIVNDHIDHAALSQGLSRLIVSDELLDKLGPAVNSGQSILLYGPPGNGKSSIAAGIARSFREMIYIPHSIEVGGQIIRVFDPTIHEPLKSAPNQAGDEIDRPTLRHATTDRRWVCVRRPVLATGTELTLDMLDLKHRSRGHWYDAPFRMKACGGVILVDDFGHQPVRPIEILNRWGSHTEGRMDHLTLENGRRVPLFLDTLVIYSTNLELKNVLGTSIMRRIPYRICIDPPSCIEFVQILHRECEAHDLELPDDVVAFLVNGGGAMNGRLPARYHARFIVEHAVASCNFRNVPPKLDRALVRDAMESLHAGG